MVSTSVVCVTSASESTFFSSSSIERSTGRIRAATPPKNTTAKPSSVVETWFSTCADCARRRFRQPGKAVRRSPCTRLQSGLQWLLAFRSCRRSCSQQRRGGSCEAKPVTSRCRLVFRALPRCACARTSRAAASHQPAAQAVPQPEPLAVQGSAQRVEVCLRTTHCTLLRVGVQRARRHQRRPHRAAGRAAQRRRGSRDSAARGNGRALRATGASKERQRAHRQARARSAQSLAAFARTVACSPCVAEGGGALFALPGRPAAPRRAAHHDRHAQRQ